MSNITPKLPQNLSRCCRRFEETRIPPSTRTIFARTRESLSSLFSLHTLTHIEITKSPVRQDGSNGSRVCWCATRDEIPIYTPTGTHRVIRAGQYRNATVTLGRKSSLASTMLHHEIWTNRLRLTSRRWPSKRRIARRCCVFRMIAVTSIRSWITVFFEPGAMTQPY